MSERSMRQLLKLVARQVGLSYTDIVEWLREQNSLEAIEARILQGNYVGAITNVDDAARMLAADIHDGYVLSGKRTAAWLDSKLTDKLVRFDTNDLRVVQRARANELELVRGFQDEQYAIARQITQRSLVEGAQSGTNPRRVAMDFRDSIGLTADQEKHVASYRRSLEQGDYLAATRRALSSGQADRTLRSLARRGEALTQAQIDDFTERYRENYITHRATTIARTEALRNANGGHADAIEQAIARGDVDADQLVKTWHARGGPRGRKDHTAMDETSVGVREDFELPDGTRMAYPGDPRAPARHTVHCACTESVSFA